MIKSESIKELATALSKFQNEVQDPAKNSDNPFFKSKYVELDDLLASVRPVLTQNGLSILQEPSSDGTNVTIKTILLHNSGEYIEFEALALKPVKSDPQGLGSAITYGRRYALSSILGVAWNTDDDGNKASGRGEHSKKDGPDPRAQQSTQKAAPDTAKPLQKAAPTATNQPDKKQQLLIKLAHHTKDSGLSADDVKQIMQFKFKVNKSSDLSILQIEDLLKNSGSYWNEFLDAQVANEAS